MAEDMEELEVSGVHNATSIKKPTSAWKVGLAVGGMTLNPFFGIAAGMIQKMRNKSYLEHAAAQRTADLDENEQLQSTIDSELKIADPDEQRLIKYAKGRIADANERIAGGDKSGYALREHAQGILEQIMGKDIDARKQDQQANNSFQRELIGTAAKGYQTEFQNTKSAFDQINKQAQQILDLVAQKDFDPNKPLNKAHLAELLNTGGLMFKDSPDMGDALTQGVSAVNGIAGGIVGGIATAFKSKDFKVTAEDYNRLALNAQKYGKIFAEQNFSRLGSQGAALDKWGKQLGAIPEDYSLADYISGGEKEIRMTPNPVFTGGGDTTNANEPMRGAPRAPAPTATLGTAPRTTGGRGARPTN